VQTLTGSGGWPLNVFLTPEAKPFYGGTYFPPVRSFNRASWQETLLGIIKAFNESRGEVDSQAENLTAHLEQSSSLGIRKSDTATELFAESKLNEVFENLMNNSDRVWGGFGRAPKFPQTFSIQYLLRYYYFFQNDAALSQALLSLDKMIEGGIYDQVGGGFARYATDTKWLIPHFEKMLYDNALLVSVLSEAFQLTKRERYRDVINETMQFLQRELLHPAGGFYSALDADSEGEEGKYYVWNKSEVESLLGEDADVFCNYYDITDGGNWEGKNILHAEKPPEQFAQENKVFIERVNKILETGRTKLLEQRKGRTRPLLDDKIILGWNALMNSACSKAFAATGNAKYREMALANMKFLLEQFASDKPDEFLHTWKNGQARFPAFLDDYAFLIQALIHLQEITGDVTWLNKAKDITAGVVRNFGDENTGFFFYTRADQQDVIVRKKEIYDGAVPSGNAIMAAVLYQLSIYFDKSDWRQRSSEMLRYLGQVITRYPTSFGCWDCLLLEMTMGTIELAITGRDFNSIHQQLLAQFIPNKVVMATAVENEQFALLAGKPIAETTEIYVCKNFTCLKPVTSVNETMSYINGIKRLN
jgi:uncharacterized protein YyaL (SSP411 family)